MRGRRRLSGDDGKGSVVAHDVVLNESKCNMTGDLDIGRVMIFYK